MAHYVIASDLSRAISLMSPARPPAWLAGRLAPVEDAAAGWTGQDRTGEERRGEEEASWRGHTYSCEN